MSGCGWGGGSRPHRAHRPPPAEVVRCEELHAVLHLVLSAGNHLNAVSGPRPPPPPPPRGPAAAVTACSAPGRLRGQRRRVSPGLAAEAARHQGQRAGRGPAALRGHGECPRERLVGGKGGVVVRSRSVMRDPRSAPAGPLRTGCGGDPAAPLAQPSGSVLSLRAECPSVGCRSSPARPKVAPTPQPPHGARSSPLGCSPPLVPPAWSRRSPHRRHRGSPRGRAGLFAVATPGPPELCSSDGGAQLSVTAGPYPHHLRGALSRAVRAALGRPLRQAMPCGAVPCSAPGVAAPPAPGDASGPLSCPCCAPATALSCTHRVPVSHVRVMPLLHPYRAPVLPPVVVPLSCAYPVRVTIAPRRRRHGPTDACWTSRANCRTWARPRGAGNAADTRGARRGRPGAERSAPVGSKRRRWRRSCGGCRRAWRRRGVRERRCARRCGRSCGRRRRSCARCGRRGNGCAEPRRQLSTSTARRRRRARCGSCVRCCTASRAAS